MNSKELTLILNKAKYWATSKILIKLPDAAIIISILEEDNILSGKTTIRKESGEVKAIITISISNNVMQKPNIEQGIKLVLIHEICHLVNLKDPDQAMKEYFPKEFNIWNKAQDAQALKCGVEFKWI